MDVEMFEEFILEAVNEISGRHTDYLSQYGVTVSDMDAAVRGCCSELTFNGDLRGSLTEALAKGLKYLEHKAIPVHIGGSPTDRISILLTRAILDAYLAANDEVGLRPSPEHKSGATDPLLGTYSLEKSAEGVCYALRKGSGRPILIIPSIGVPLSVWSQLLQDRSIDGRPLLVESRTGPLLEGGAPYEASMWDDLPRIGEVLQREEIFDACLISWCDGTRLAVELARTMPERVASLLLVAPSFHGQVDAKWYPSPFEDNLAGICKMMGRDANRDHMFLQSVTRDPVGDPVQRQNDPETRADVLLRMPPIAHRREILMPLSSVEYFRNYVRRLSIDESYDIQTAISEIRRPILLLTGTHDAAVNTRATRDVLKRRGQNVTHATIFGAGHHIPLMQYSYFRYVLQSLIANKPVARTARLSIERLAG